VKHKWCFNIIITNRKTICTHFYIGNPVQGAGNFLIHINGNVYAIVENAIS